MRMLQGCWCTCTSRCWQRARKMAWIVESPMKSIFLPARHVIAACAGSEMSQPEVIAFNSDVVNATCVELTEQPCWDCVPVSFVTLFKVRKFPDELCHCQRVQYPVPALSPTCSPVIAFSLFKNNCTKAHFISSHFLTHFLRPHMRHTPVKSIRSTPASSAG